jgi:peptidyl-prolyl cis-trans isomerase SurA
MLLLPVIIQSQDLNSKTLMSVDKSQIQSGEFIRMYKKSRDPGKKLDIDDYLQQYILFKLKVADALKEGYDTTKTFQNELNGYRNQLAQNYLSDNQVKEALLRKTYQRSLTEINGWHILISLPQEVSPDDTLLAWQKAAGIRARGASDDPSVKVNGGNLGYFTVFQMIMPFEDAAYSLKTGEISEPVRTPYGYHIIKVTDKRPSKGKIKVAHIMKASPPGTDDTEAKKAEDEINNIYIQLLDGASFKDLARKYSDHKESSSKGGELNWFGTGEIIPAFSEAAFSISDTGKFTKPVRTVYGWHIIKLLDKKLPGTFEESRSFLESKLNQSYLNSLSKKSFVEKLKKEYKFTIDKSAYNWFIGNTDTLIIQGVRKYNRITMPDIKLYTFEKQNITTNEFADYIENRKLMIKTNDPTIFINTSIDTHVSDHIIDYENSILEKKYPEFRYLMNEFHDGLLMFEISGKRVWNKVSTDSAGIRNYYENHKMLYLSRIGVDTKIYTLKSLGGEKILKAAYEKYSRKKDVDRQLIDHFNKQNDTLLVIKEATFYKGDNRGIDSLKWVTGTQSLNIGGFPSLVVIKKVIPPAPLNFESVMGEMMAGYQEYLEKEWIKQLKEKFSVKIDSLILEEVKNKLINE